MNVLWTSKEVRDKDKDKDKDRDKDNDKDRERERVRYNEILGLHQSDIKRNL